jgi:hypothetical protein
MNRPVAKQYVVLRLDTAVVGKPLEQVLWGVRAVKVYHTMEAAMTEADRLNQLNGPKGVHYFVSNANAPDEPPELDGSC